MKKKQIKTIGYLPTTKGGKILSCKVYKTHSTAKGQATRIVKAKKNKPNGSK